MSLASGFFFSSGDGGFVVDTGGDLVVTINSECDFTSIKYQGTEYQNADSFSHLASGLGSDASVSYEIINDSAVFSCPVSNDDFDLTQYYIFSDGTATIRLGTTTVSNPSVGELRFIFRLTGLYGAYPTGNVSDTRAGTVIESEDIWEVDGETRAKVHCAYDDVYACFIKPIRAYEASTGGPFYRDIRLNRIADDRHDSSCYMNHGDFPWDVVRTGFHGPYIFTFATSRPDPADFDDYRFIEDLNIEGYIGESDRGRVVGTASGTSDDFPIVVHWYNDDHQQWVYADSNGSFTSPPLAAGVYTQAFYQDELLAGTVTVTVKAAATAVATITATNPIITEDRTKIFQIGDYDGRPVGFLNADKQERMHVSDDRMGAWDTPTFIVGTDSAGDYFPMAIFQDINNNREIEFELDSEVTAEAKIRIGTTLAFYYGEPAIQVNSYTCENFENPNGSSGRGITKGMTHGDMTVYICEFPAGTLVEGTNTVTLGVTSSADDSSWLSPNYVSRISVTNP
ncbi:hypothetical protein BDV12DRAFT_186584 [Aspergillus spectabilis]